MIFLVGLAPQRINHYATYGHLHVLLPVTEDVLWKIQQMPQKNTIQSFHVPFFPSQHFLSGDS